MAWVLLMLLRLILFKGKYAACAIMLYVQCPYPLSHWLPSLRTVSYSSWATLRSRPVQQCRRFSAADDSSDGTTGPGLKVLCPLTWSCWLMTSTTGSALMEPPVLIKPKNSFSFPTWTWKQACKHVGTQGASPACSDAAAESMTKR